jgi:hypothetical protein
VIAAADTLIASSTVDVARNVGILLGVVFWLATVYWVYKDARRRIEDPWLVAMATVLGAIPPFLGPLIYMLFRPPEYLDEVRERELEMLAMEERLAEHGLRADLAGVPVLRDTRPARGRHGRGRAAAGSPAPDSALRLDWRPPWPSRPRSCSSSRTA